MYNSHEYFYCEDNSLLFVIKVFHKHYNCEQLISPITKTHLHQHKANAIEMFSTNLTDVKVNTKLNQHKLHL